MNANETFRLLILNDSREEVERLVSMLKNAGRSIRPQHAESEEALTKLLQEQSWDLMIAQEGATNLPPVNAIRQINRLNKDVPVILISDREQSEAVVDGLKMGARDVIPLDQDQHLLLVIQRELNNREHRQRQRVADRKLREAERRSQQLLDSSRDALAYVQDGMYLYANQSFAERFGYKNPDDIDCMPIIDMVAEQDQAKVKHFLKEFVLKGDEAESCELTFLGIRENGSTCSLNIQIAMAMYDEEPCIQFMLPASNQANSLQLQEQIEDIKNKDTLTGLYNRQYLTDTLEQEMSTVLNDETTSTLLYIEVDEFIEKLQTDLGLSRSDQLFAMIAEQLESKITPEETLARFSDNSFMLLSPKQSADSAIERAELWCQELQKQLFILDGTEVEITTSIGIALVNEISDSVDGIIEQAMQAVEVLRKENGKGNACKLFEVEPVIDEKTAVDIAKQVQAALNNNRFQLLFQPIISLRGSEDEHYEVLLRMLDDNDQAISPNEFMKTAEKIGAINKIDRWAILETIKTLTEHRAGGHRTRVLLNLSGQSMCDDTLAPWLKVAFQAANLSPEAIIFQVDENSASAYLDEAKRFFDALGEIGSQTSLSNFGCTLNPFDTLNHVSPDYVKVHGSFTQEVQNNEEDSEALKALIRQLLEANKITIVPFVENAKVLSTLWQTGVHYIQGHYLQGPVDSMNYDFTMEN